VIASLACASSNVPATAVKKLIPQTRHCSRQLHLDRVLEGRNPEQRTGEPLEAFRKPRHGALSGTSVENLRRL
jgi:hypothetical protein